ncbi:MAG TPA: MFS transporter [Planctomycetes bacterium]|nr:MFS transporter [Planctomycetota bacterium]HIL52608.1 MFS transporter [Planctomycetota bacterium]
MGPSLKLPAAFLSPLGLSFASPAAYKGPVKNPPKQRSILGLVFLTVFIDLIGFSIIFPLFPAMLEHYVELEGQSSLIGKLHGALVEFVAGKPGAEFAVVTLFGGLLGSIYSLLQFLFAPFWGHLSDRRGRRGTLLWTLGGTALSYAIWFCSGSFSLLILARLVGGIMAGNISIASAIISDTTTGPERAKGMGIVGMAIGLGFVVGPAIGGATSLVDLTELWPASAAWGVNPFSLAAGCALVLSLFNWIWALTHLPETRPQSATEEITGTRTWRPFKALKSIDYPGVKRTAALTMMYLTAFSAMEFTLTFLAAERFDYTPRDMAWMFVFIGLTIALVQGGLVRRLVPRLGEKKVSIAGLAILVPGFVAVGYAAGSGALYGGLFLMAVGSALAMPCLSALISRYSPDDVQGLVLGSYRSVGALARALGPLLGGTLYWLYGSRAPYLVGAVLLLWPLFLALKLPPVAAADKTSTPT